ncbi:hypothetical protein, partial [Methanomethylophilus alvi]|uniref:hypothetical protein n=1 Tax=Methanomethylophilus alvi TaxID=1291540 RepID=UPI0037DCB069
LTDHTVYRKLRLFPVLGAISGEFFSVSYKISGSFNGKCTRFHSRKWKVPMSIPDIPAGATSSATFYNSRFKYEFHICGTYGAYVFRGNVPARANPKR